MVGREGKMRRIKKKNSSILSAISLKVKLIAVGVLLCLIGVSAFWVSEIGQRFRKNIHQTYTYMMNKTHLTLQNVSIEGHYRTTAEEVNEVLNLVQGMDILDIDLALVQNQIAELPWVDSVSVERHLPDTVYIRITEKKPIAIWQHNKTYFPLDETGEPIDDNETVLSNLILVVGSDAPEYTADLITVLNKYPVIKNYVVSAVRVGGRRWNLILHDVNDGIRIYLPETDIEGALERLTKAQETEHVLDKDLKVIDLRIDDRFIIRTDATLIEEED